MATLAHELLRDNECGEETAIDNTDGNRLVANDEHRLGLKCMINKRVKAGEWHQKCLRGEN